MTHTVLDPPEDPATRLRLPRTGLLPTRRADAPAPWAPLTRLLARPAVAVGLAVLGTLMLALIGVASPNDHTLEVRLPLSLLPTLPGAASTYITIGAIALQLVGLLGMLAANAAGWRPDPRRLLLVGAVAVAVFACVSPIGSADTASYAAYGRIAALGGDPYTTGPDWLGGAYEHLVSSSWLTTPSVYGPIATWLQQCAAFVGGSRPWLTIWLLMLANGAVYVAVGWVLIRTAADKTRAALLWAANPLLIGLLVGGGHLDTYIAALAVVAVLFARRGRYVRDDLLAGVFVGLACGVKVSAALVGVGLVLPLLRQGATARALRISASAGVTLLLLYGAYGLHMLAPLSTASGLVSVPSAWQLLRWLGGMTIGPVATADVISAAWPVLLLLIAYLLFRRIGRTAPAVVALPFALVFAWILVAPWCMPWYAAVVWPLVALLPRSASARWLAVVTAGLALVHNTGGHGWVW
ncbi:hypothetical protein [Streptacidiphilus sp. EB129]|uniref:hypothetical protein n=1 Tax=Streptacidiphilus sp. EB129 TaxID=3156262 RepID=UPI00351283B2